MNSEQWVNTLNPLLGSAENALALAQSRANGDSYKNRQQVVTLSEEVRQAEEKRASLEKVASFALSNWVVGKESKIGVIADLEASPGQDVFTVWVNWFWFDLEEPKPILTPKPEAPNQITPATPRQVLAGLEKLINECLVFQDEQLVQVAGISEKARKPELKEKREKLLGDIKVAKRRYFQYVALGDKICRNLGIKLEVELDRTGVEEVKLGQFSRGRLKFEEVDALDTLRLDTLPNNCYIPSGVYAKRKETPIEEGVVQIVGFDVLTPDQVMTDRGNIKLEDLMILPGHQDPMANISFPIEKTVMIPTIYGEQPVRVEIKSKSSVDLYGMISPTGYRSMHPPLDWQVLADPERLGSMCQELAIECHKEMPMDTDGQPILDGDIVRIIRGKGKGHEAAIHGCLFEETLRFKEDADTYGGIGPNRLKLVSRSDDRYPILIDGETGSETVEIVTTMNNEASALPEKVTRYNQFKVNHQDKIVFVLAGDFYETYYQDAERFSQVAEFVISTISGTDDSDRIPFTGLPVHAVDRYREALKAQSIKAWFEGSEGETETTEATAPVETTVWIAGIPHTGKILEITPEISELPEKPSFVYSSIEAEAEVREILGEIDVASRASIRSDYFNGERLHRIKTEKLQHDEYTPFLKSKEWKYSVRTATDLKNVYLGAMANELSLDELEKLHVNPTDLRKLFAPKNAEAAAEISALIKLGAEINTVILRKVIAKHAPRDEFEEVESGCYSCKHYYIKSKWRFCNFHDSRLVVMEDGSELDAAMGCINREEIPTLNADAESVEEETETAALAPADVDDEEGDVLEVPEEAEVIRLPRELATRLQTLADTEGADMNELTVRLLSTMLIPDPTLSDEEREYITAGAER